MAKVYTNTGSADKFEKVPSRQRWAGIELRDSSDGFYATVALHVPTGRRFVFISDGRDFETAERNHREQAAAIDPFNGEWQFGSLMLVRDTDTDHGSDFESPIPYKLANK